MGKEIIGIYCSTTVPNKKPVKMPDSHKTTKTNHNLIFNNLPNRCMPYLNVAIPTKQIIIDGNDPAA